MEILLWYMNSMAILISIVGIEGCCSNLIIG